MSLAGVADGVIAGMEQGFDFVMCNFAAPDMVGHTGDYSATLTAVEATDVQIGRCLEAAGRLGYAALVTSDHGNAEEMLDELGQPKTSHNCNRVPLALSLPPSLGGRLVLKGDAASSLRDVAPTICEVMGVGIPAEMTGRSLVVRM